MARGLIPDADPGFSALRARRASGGLTVLAAALLVCGAVVAAMGGIQGASVSGPPQSVPASPTVSVAPLPVCVPGRHGPMVCSGEVRLPNRDGSAPKIAR
ncbi:hypothetical protein [Streptacidiphilus melanogenes]|uniref:hypothetical protein n=1 Tax=Streptacidiphilus melanogenes TaxID=411235 RepID=UPI0005A7DC30|nr:hypothetical protein [Streptacidiphilus melanogenes]